MDADLLREARAAEERLIDAERDAEVARADFHRAIRRLQLAGGSLREIADALGISHQRVHQMVADAGGARGWRAGIGRRSKAVPPEIRCSFCGHLRDAEHRVVAGSRIYICEQCMTLAGKVIATGEVAATPLSAVKTVPADVATAKCSFCGKRRHQVSGIALAAAGTICTECLALCKEIMDEELGEQA
jgi:hypothetical protein